MLPKGRAIEIPLVKEIARRGGKCVPSEHVGGKTVYETLADFFELTKEDLDKANESDGRSKWENDVRQARRCLVDLDVISNSVLGVWELTDRGEEVADFVKEVPFTPESLAKLTSSSALAILVEKYNSMINAGIDKGKALEIVEANDCRSVLELLG
jgi:hypothetical protein